MELLLYLTAVFIIFISQIIVQTSYKKYSNIDSDASLTGAMIARRILDNNNCKDVSVQVQEKGVLSDFYDPKTNQISLSPQVYNDSSIASIAVAAHECGHALQYEQGYRFISIRNSILPLAIVCGNLSLIVIVFGLLLGNSRFGRFTLTLGIFMFGIVALFQLATLPLELDASRRAMKQLSGMSDVSSSDLSGSKQMLAAAAFTYLAALLSTVLQIMRFVLISRRNNHK